MTGGTFKKKFFGFLEKLSTGWGRDTLTPEQTYKQAYDQAQKEIVSQLKSLEHSLDNEEHQISEDVVLFCQSKLKEVLTLSGFDGDVVLEKQENGRLLYTISDSQDSGRIIGKDGATLEAYQVLLRAMVFKKYGHPIRVGLDVGNYRQKRQDALKEQAIRLSQSLDVKGKKAELKSMSPEERRMIHHLFQQDKQIRSYSVGDGFYRRVILERR